VNLRLERPEDREASLAVERAAFDTPDEPRIVDEVRDAPGSFAIVAEEDGRVVGHVQLSIVWVGSDEVVGLGPIGVLPDRQGSGVGSGLVAAALEEARTRGACAVILLGSPAYYGARGFEPAAPHGLRNPFVGVQPDGFVIAEEDLQIAVLDAERVARLAGEVRWHPAFDPHG